MMLRSTNLWAALLLALVFILPVLADLDTAAKPKPTRKTQAELDEEAGNAPWSEKLTKIGKAYLIGKRTFVDYEQRVLEDEDDGVTRLTDANYHETVEMGNEDDVWVIIMHGDQTHRGSPMYYEAHTEAVKLAKASDSPNLEHVKWARMDYVDEWKQCARWQIFRPPQLVIATNGGKDLRFFNTRQFPAKGDIIFEFIEAENWKQVPTWKGRFGPHGSAAWVAEAYIRPQELLFEKVGHVPSFVYMLVFGAIAKYLSEFLGNLFASDPTPVTPVPKPKPTAKELDNAKVRSTSEAVEKALKDMRSKRQVAEAKGEKAE